MWLGLLSPGAVLTGRSDAGTHGGQAILARKKCHALLRDDLMISSAALGGELRRTACEVRFKGVTVVAVEAYLWTGIGSLVGTLRSCSSLPRLSL